MAKVGKSLKQLSQPLCGEEIFKRYIIESNTQTILQHFYKQLMWL